MSAETGWSRLGEGVVQEGHDGVVLDRVQEPVVRHEVRRGGVPHVTELPDHHLRHPGGVDQPPPTQHHQLPQVGPRHPALGADVDPTNV